MQQITVRIPEQIEEAIQKEVEYTGRTKSEIVRATLTEKLEVRS